MLQPFQDNPQMRSLLGLDGFPELGGERLLLILALPGDFSYRLLTNLSGDTARCFWGLHKDWKSSHQTISNMG